jgi:hypothetical protein
MHRGSHMDDTSVGAIGRDHGHFRPRILKFPDTIVGDGRARENQRLELTHPFQLTKPSVRNRRIPRVEEFELTQAGQMGQSGVADSSTLKPEPLQTIKASKVGDARVSDPIVREVQSFQITDIGDGEHALIRHSRTAQAEMFKATQTADLDHVVFGHRAVCMKGHVNNRAQVVKAGAVDEPLRRRRLAGVDNAFGGIGRSPLIIDRPPCSSHGINGIALFVGPTNDPGQAAAQHDDNGHECAHAESNVRSAPERPCSVMAKHR